MSDFTPYQAPDSDVVTADAGYAAIEVFSTTQRIGRLRWLAYNFVFTVVLTLVFSIISAVSLPMLNTGGEAGGPSPLAYVPVVMFYVVSIVVSLILARRRLHDLDKPGWFSVLLFIPLINIILGLYLMFAPGTRGNNRFGNRPAPNNALTWIAGLIAPIIILGIIAAIAVPAYNQYVERAKAAAGSQLQQ